MFRREALEAGRHHPLGEISLAQPVKLWLLAIGVAIAALAAVIFLATGQYHRRSRVSGQLVPNAGLATVLAPTSGVVADVFAEEGERIRAGAALVRVEMPRGLRSGDDALVVIQHQLDERNASTTQLGHSQVDQIQAQRRGTSEQLAVSRLELRQVEQAIATRSRQVRLGQDTTDRYRQLADTGYVSQMQLDQQEQAVLGLVNEQQALQRQATTIRRGIAQMEQALRELPAQLAAAQAATRRDLAALEQERAQQDANGQMLIKAPVAGVVTSRLIEPGQSVQDGQPMLSVLPQDSLLQAQLLVPSRAVGFIRPGDRVLLRYQPYPYQKFGHQGGTVTRVSRSAIAADASRAAEPSYRVLVRLDAQTIQAYGNAEPLRPGMLLEADILGEPRRLYEWLLEPLYSLRGNG
jgi:membrane fusion protein